MLAVHGVTVELGGREVLRGVDFVVERGEFVAVVGPNGAGKSTLLRVATAELGVADGLVSYDGEPAGKLSALQLARRRAVLPQRSQLEGAFRVDEVVRFGRAPHELRFDERHHRAVVERALHLVDLQAHAERRWDGLSGGERQRVQLARVLAQCWPGDGERLGYLLLDEPTAALDLAHTLELLRLAREWSRRGLGVVAVLHDLNFATQFADRIVVLHQGRIIADGAPRVVVTADLLASAFSVEAEVRLDSITSLPFVIPRAPLRGPSPEALRARDNQ